MENIPQDTSPDAARELIRIARAMTPEAKFMQVSRLIEATRELAMAGLRSRHPDASEA